MTTIDIPRELRALWDKYPQYEFIARLKQHSWIKPLIWVEEWDWMWWAKINEMIKVINEQQEQMKKLTQWDILWKWWHIK